MKKVVFEFQETVTYMHSIEVEIEESQEDRFEVFADDVAEKIEESPESYGRDDVVHMFNKEFGADNVEFCEDGSPSVEYEAI